MSPIPSRDELEKKTAKNIKILCKQRGIDTRYTLDRMIDELCGQKNREHVSPDAVVKSVRKSKHPSSRAAEKAPKGITEDKTVSDMLEFTGVMTRSRAHAVPSLGTGLPSLAGGSGVRGVRRTGGAVARRQKTVPEEGTTTMAKILILSSEKLEEDSPTLPAELEGQELLGAQERRGQVVTTEVHASQPDNAAWPPVGIAQELTEDQLQERIDAIEAKIPAIAAAVAKIPAIAARTSAIAAETSAIAATIPALAAQIPALAAAVDAADAEMAVLSDRIRTLEQRVRRRQAMY